MRNRGTGPAALLADHVARVASSAPDYPKTAGTITTNAPRHQHLCHGTAILALSGLRLADAD